MKGKLFILTIFMLFSVVSYSAGIEQNLAKFYTTGEKASWLAGYHEKKDVTCVSCHGENFVIDDSESSINKACVECHGTLDQMGELSKEEINPHKSHFGQMSCTSCHKGHETSYSYCNNCHNFDETIAFNGAKKVYPIENFDAYNNAKPIRTEKIDVVVIGSGGAGSSAALMARETGASVIILEKMPVAGGNTLIGAGSMNAANTKFQKEKGIQDSVELMISDTMKGGKNMNDPALVKVFAEQSSSSIDWLDEHGIRLNYFIGIGGGASAIRGHSPDGGKPVGAYILKGMKENLAKQKVETRLNSYVVRINTDEKGSVTGVLVKGKHTGLYEIKAKAVVIAAGGFGANKAMVVKYRPDALAMSTSNQPGSTGDSIALGTRAGGDLVGIDQIQIHPSIAVGSSILVSEKTRGVGAVLINMEGKRFTNELLTRDKVSAAIIAQPSSKAYLVFDEAMRSNMGMLQGYTHLGLVKEDKTLEGLAEKLDVNKENFVKTITEYNEAFKNKLDPVFGRTNMKGAISTPNFCAILISPGVHYTMGGLKIDTETHVLNAKGEIIPNLFAAGEASGGVHGGNRLGGNSISETITFGRIAGKNAGELAKSKK